MQRHPLLSLALLALSACSTGLTAGTARTLPEGAVQHGIGVVPWVFVSELCNEDGSGCFTDVFVQPPPPIYQLRYGLTDRVELGGTATFTEVAARLRWNLLRGETLALSLQPGLLVAFGTGLHSLDDDGGGGAALIPGLEGAMLLDVRLGEVVTLVPRLLARWVPVPEAGIGPRSHLAAELGVHLRLSDRFALEPSIGATEITSDRFEGAVVPRVGLSILWGGFAAEPG